MLSQFAFIPLTQHTPINILSRSSCLVLSFFPTHTLFLITKYFRRSASQQTLVSCILYISLNHIASPILHILYSQNFGMHLLYSTMLYTTHSNFGMHLLYSTILYTTHSKTVIQYFFKHSTRNPSIQRFSSFRFIQGLPSHFLPGPTVTFPPVLPSAISLMHVNYWKTGILKSLTTFMCASLTFFFMCASLPKLVIPVLASSF